MSRGDKRLLRKWCCVAVCSVVLWSCLLMTEGKGVEKEEQEQVPARLARRTEHRLESRGNLRVFQPTEFSVKLEKDAAERVVRGNVQVGAAVKEEEEGRQFFLGRPANRGKKRRLRPWWGNGGNETITSNGPANGNNSSASPGIPGNNVTGGFATERVGGVGTGVVVEAGSSTHLVFEQDRECPNKSCEEMTGRAGTEVVQSTIPLFLFLLAVAVHTVAGVIFFYFWKNIYFPVNDPYATVSPYGFQQLSDRVGTAIDKNNKYRRKKKKFRKRIGG